ncbi:thermonuclease family protein [Candidatus Pacearchaeota archaeon]|nr:thermonuclease family protein [Candidatus Pacearchaeota archaeon]
MRVTIKTPIIITISLIVLAILIFISLKLLSNQNSFPQTGNETAVYITDGDTFETSLGERIRLLCVDTPEQGKTGYEDSKIFLSTFVLGREVLIEREGLDVYNRTIAWISVKVNEETILVNKAIVDSGYGELFEYNGTNCERMK